MESLSKRSLKFQPSKAIKKLNKYFNYSPDLTLFTNSAQHYHLQAHSKPDTYAADQDNECQINMLCCNDPSQPQQCVYFIPEAWDHLGKAYDLLDAVRDKVSQVGQHGKLCVVLSGVRTAGSILVHHQKAAEVHLGINRLCLRISQEINRKGKQ